MQNKNENKNNNNDNLKNTNKIQTKDNKAQKIKKEIKKDNIINKNIDVDSDTFLTGTNLIQQNKSININKEKEKENKNETIPEQKEEAKKLQKKGETKKTYNNIYINNFHNKFFKDKDNKIMSVLEKAEAAYNQIKTQIDMLLSKPETDDDEEISAQNTDMLEYFNQLNKIVSFLSDNTKIPMKPKNDKKQEKNVDPSKNNEKILNIYKKENEKLKKKNY